MRNIKKPRGKGRTTYGIVVDGKTEKWYLEKLRASINPAGITIKPELPHEKSLKDQFELIKDNAEKFDFSIWIIDLDVVISESRIPELKGYIAEASKNPKIHVLINTPCLEFWFLQHVKDAGKYYALGDAVIEELKKYDPLKAYQKSENYFVNTTPNIYERLKNFLPAAIINARKRGNFDHENPKKGLAEIHKLFSILGIEVV
jgi:hypothetical protein